MGLPVRLDKNGKVIAEEEYQRRQKLSRQAKDMHAEVVDPATGRRKFGGLQPGSGRPRKRKVAEEMLERANEKSEDVIDALFSGLKSRNVSIKVHTAEKILKMERQESELQLKEDDFDRSTRDELLEFLVPLAAKLVDEGVLPRLSIDDQVIDGTAQEVTDEPKVAAEEENLFIDNPFIASNGASE